MCKCSIRDCVVPHLHVVHACTCTCICAGSRAGGQEGGVGVQGTQTDDEDTVQKGEFPSESTTLPIHVDFIFVHQSCLYIGSLCIAHCAWCVCVCVTSREFPSECTIHVDFIFCIYIKACSLSVHVAKGVVVHYVLY